MRAQETPAPELLLPTEEGTDSAERIINNIIDFYEQEPALVIISGLITAAGVGMILSGVIYAISKAGHFQPPRVVLSVITGLVAMLAIIAVIIRPGVEALGVAVGTAIGGLVGALGTAYSDAVKSKGDTGEPPEPPEPEESPEPREPLG